MTPNRPTIVIFHSRGFIFLPKSLIFAVLRGRILKGVSVLRIGGHDMTNEQKETLVRLRLEGFGYSSIAKAVGLSVNTVKSNCRRNNLPCLKGESHDDRGKKVNPLYCKYCGKLLNQKPASKPRKFCSDKCRLAWWNCHSAEVNRKAYCSFVCAHCGKEYTVYGRKQSKFCSRTCAGRHRAKNTEVG